MNFQKSCLAMGHQGFRRRCGYTLLEFSISSAIVGILMLGLMSSIQLVTSAARLADGPAHKTTQATRTLEGVLTDLQWAQSFSEQSETAVECYVPDRDGDGRSEVLRIEWKPNPEQTVYKTLKLSQSNGVPLARPLASNVKSFQLHYQTDTLATEPFPSELVSDELLLMMHDDNPKMYGKHVLLVVADASNLDGHDRYRKQLIESWGFTVEAIDDDQSQSVFDIALNRNDVVYVSASVQSTKLDDKLTGTSLGIVNEHPAMARKIGMVGEDGILETGTHLTQTIGTHFVLSGQLPGRPVGLFLNPQSLSRFSSTSDHWAAGMQVLGTRSDAPALCMMPVDAELFRPDENRGLFLGETQTLSIQSGSNEFQKRHLATQFSLASHAEVYQMAARLSVGPGRKVRFGIYDDLNGQPGTLLAQTDNYTGVGAGLELVSLNLTESIRLKPGHYWLAAGMQSGVTIRYEQENGTLHWISNGKDPTLGMAEIWTGDYMGNDERRLSLYAVYDKIEFSNGRRVQMPWGGGSVDLQQLTDFGQDLTRRSLQWAADTTPHDTSLGAPISVQTQVSQYLRPVLPHNATGWKLTRLLCQLQQSRPFSTEQITFRLTRSGEDQKPGPFLIQETKPVSCDQFSADRFQWYEIPLSESVVLSPEHGICLVMQGNQDHACGACRIDNSGDPSTLQTHFLFSNDQGSQWSQPDNLKDMRFYAYGKFITSGNPKW